MHDIKMIRENPQAFDAALAQRGLAPIADDLLALDSQGRKLTTELQAMQARRNEASKAIGMAMGKGDEEQAQALKAEMAHIKKAIPEMEEQEKAINARLADMLVALPNLPAEDTPPGEDETSNVEQSRWGSPREFAFTPQEHADFAPSLGMDFETAAKMSGARFAFLHGAMARLNRALGQFMLDMQTMQNGYIECSPPLLVRDEAVFGTGQLPKFSEDLFQTTDGRWLIPTAEVSITNSVREQILDNADLPLRLCALTQCFRSEAGSAGRDTRGLIRQHQFEKVELVCISTPEKAKAEHEHMVASAQSVLEALELPYRTMLLCAGDMGATARRTYDLEVWLPGQGAYREISSCSWCDDYQARRMNARYRPADDSGSSKKRTEFVHTLNGSGLAVGRTLVAIIENYQQEDGTVAIPSALQPYMGGLSKLEPAA